MSARIRFSGVLAVLCLSALTGHVVYSQAPAVDLVIRHGRIIDGSGNPWFRGDVAIANGRIVKVGGVMPAAAQEIDATGLVVSPGFIEMHGHSGIPLLVSGRAESTIRQGITTVSEGEGESPAPAVGFARDEIAESLRAYGLTLDWTTLGEFYGRLQRQGISTNIYTFVSEGTIREAVYGIQNRPPTPAEMDQMKALTEQAMKDGAFGLSSSMSHPPGIWASAEEYIELAKIAARYGGIYTRHLEDESDSLINAIESVIAVAEGAKVPAEIFHLKVAGPRNWGKLADQAIQTIEKARARGLEVWADQYPYERSGWPLSNSIPSWAREGGDAEMVRRLQDFPTRRRIRADIEKGFINSGIGMTKDGLENIYIATLASPANQKHIGKSVAAIARERDMEPIETFFDLLIEEKGKVGATYWWMDDADIRAIMKQP